MSGEKNKKRLLLLNPPADDIYIRDYYCSFLSKGNYYWPPQDLIVLSGVLKDKFNIKVIDGIVEKKLKKIKEKIIDFKPEIIIFTTGTATVKNDLIFIKEIKGILKHAKIYASGGIFFFMNNKIFLEVNNFIDGIILNPTELEINNLLSGKIIKRNAVYRIESNIMVTEFRQENNYKIPIPEHKKFPFKKYFIPIVKKLPFTVVTSSMGCPYRCKFCTIANFPYFYRDIINFVDEIEYAVSIGIKEFLFQDPNFALSKKRLKNFLNELQKRNLKIGYICNATANNLDREMVELLKESGCHTVMIGVESGAERILKLYNKPATKEQIKNAFKLCNKYHIRSLGYFIIGFPEETKEEILSTINFAKELDPFMASFSLASPDFGSPISKKYIDYDEFSKGNISWDRTTQLYFPKTNLSLKEILKLKRKAYIKFYLRLKYIIKIFPYIFNFKLFKIYLLNAFYIFFKRHK